MGLKTIIIGLFSFFNCLAGIHTKWHPENNAKQPFYLPEGKATPEADKPSIPHLSRCQGFAVKYYSFTLDALDLRHPRLLQR